MRPYTLHTLVAGTPSDLVAVDSKKTVPSECERIVSLVSRRGGLYMCAHGGMNADDIIKHTKKEKGKMQRAAVSISLLVEYMYVASFKVLVVFLLHRLLQHLY